MKGEKQHVKSQHENGRDRTVQLAPLCTFSDAEQPMRRFVFRLKGGEDGVSAALFEADGNAWKNTAIQNIKTYFEREIPQELRDDVIILA